MSTETRQVGNSFVNLVFSELPLIATVWVVCVVVALLAALLIPKSYEARSTILVKYGREYIYVPETGNERASAPQRAGLEEAINSEVQILASRDLSERVIESVGLERLYPDLAGQGKGAILAMERFRNALDIRPIERSNIINVYFRHRDPGLAAQALNTLLELFPAKRLEVYRDSDVPFFSDRVSALEEELAQAERQFAEFRSSNGLYDVDEQKRELLARMSRLQAEIAEGEKALAEARSRQAALSRSLRTEPRTITIYTDSDQGRTLDEARRKLFDLRLRESQLLTTYQPESKVVTSLRREIARTEQFITDAEVDVTGLTTRVGTNDVHESLRSEKLRTDAQVAALGERMAVAVDQLARMNTELTRLLSLESQYATQRRKVDALRDALRASLTDVSDAQTLAAMDQRNRTNIRVVQRAVPPVHGVGLSRKTRVLLSIPLGLVAGLLAALALHMFRPQVSEPTLTARRSGLDVLATFDRKDG